MTRSGEAAVLRRLARSHGLLVDYLDADGRHRSAPEETLSAMLRSLGVPVGRSAGKDALRRRRRAHWSTPVDPVVVGRAGRVSVPVLRLPAGRSRRPVRFEVAFEDGGSFAFDLDPEPDRDPVRRVEGARYHRVRSRQRVELPVGYHRGTVSVAGESTDFHWFVAPAGRGVPPERRLGVFAPVYALRSARRGACGDLEDLERLACWLGRRWGAACATLPLGAAWLEPPVEPSPYNPISRLLWNETYLGGGGEDDGGALVDWPGVAAQCRERLDGAAAATFAGPDAERRRLEEFLARHPEAERFARFCAAAARWGRDWRRWPEPARRGELAPEDAGGTVYARHAWGQWQCERRMRALGDAVGRAGGGLYLDLPLGVHPDGYDAWTRQEQFLEGCNVGAPPDPFFTGGQEWGFRPPRPDACRARGHEYFRACVRHHLAHCGTLRLDHVMALHRLYCIPHGAEARDGVYLAQPAEELYAVLAIEAERTGGLVVGEDLGTVPAATGRAMERWGVRSMHVVQFELDEEEGDRALEAEPGAQAALNTHDMPTFAGFVAGRDVDDRIDLGLLDRTGAETERARRTRCIAALRAALHRRGRPAETGEELLAAVLTELAAGDADLLVVGLEDLWLEPAPQNVPGTTGERPNWRRRMRFSLEEIETMRPVQDLLDELARTRRGRRRDACPS